jgi:hypothetical protein
MAKKVSRKRAIEAYMKDSPDRTLEDLIALYKFGRQK